MNDFFTAIRRFLIVNRPAHFDTPILLDLPINEAVHAHRTNCHAFTRLGKAGLRFAAVGCLHGPSDGQFVSLGEDILNTGVRVFEERSP